MALTADQLNTVYQNVLFRPAEPAAIAFYANRTDVSDAQIRQQIELSQEAVVFTNPVIRLFEAALNRLPTQADLRFYGLELKSGFSTEQVAFQLTNSAEFAARAPGGIVTEAFVQTLYQDLLNRAAGPTEVAYYTARSAAQLVNGLANSPEAVQAQASAVITFLDTAAQGTPNTGDLDAQTGAGTGNTGGTGTVGPLTVNTDTVVGNASNNVLDASQVITAAGTAVQTLNNADQIDLQGGTDTVNIQLNTPNTTPASFKGVEVVNVQNTAAGGVNLSLANGDASTTTIGVNNSAAAANTVTISNIQSAVSTLNLTNVAGNVTLNGISNTALAGSADALTVNLNNVTGAQGLTLATAGNTNVYETLTLNSTGTLANNIGTIADVGLTRLNVTGSTALGVINNAATLATIDASTFTGALNITSVPVTALAQTITGGTGADTINIAGGYTNADVINGGLGTDTLVLTNAEATGAVAVQTNVTGIEVIGLNNALNGNLNLTNFGATGFRAATSTNGNADGDVADVGDVNNGLGAASSLTFAAGTNTIDLQNGSSNGNALTVNVNGAGTTDVVSLSIGGTTGVFGGANGDALGTYGTGAITFNGAETVNLTATGSAVTFGGAVTLTQTAANEVLNISGTQNVTFAAAVTADTINATGLTGNGALTLTSTGANPTAVTGSLNADSITTGAGDDIISGGAGNDIRLNGAGGADTLTGGAGNDTFRLATSAETRNAAFNAADTTTANIDKITDFVGNGNAVGDTIELGVAAASFGPNFVAGTTVATVTAVTIATAADFTALAAGVQAQSAGVASAVGNAQIYDVTVTSGNLAGRFLIVNDDTAAVAATDAIVSITGITGALNAQDFTFAAA